MLARADTSRTSPPDGLVDLPPGKIAAVATYLEMVRAGQPEPGEPLPLSPIGGDLARYRRLYGAIGEPWLWFSRATMTDERLRAIITHPAVAVLALTADGQDIGLIELDFRAGRDCELAFLGLAPGATGRGLGRRLVRDAIRLAFTPSGTERLWLHTCTLDHPAALPTYLGAGLRPYRRAIEIADDPRLTGHMPRTAGAGFPILDR